MKYTTLILLGFLTCLSCKKGIEPEPTPPVVTETPEREISLSVYGDPSHNQIEIIVSDTAAKFLLDTLVSIGDMHFLKVRSEQTKFNITTVDFDQPSGIKYVQTFYQVTPDHWKINQANNVGFYDSSYETKVEGELFYYNLPQNVQAASIQFGNAYAGGYNGIDKTITLNYSWKLPYLSCVLFPSLRLYHFYETTNIKDSVNLAQMDTALTFTFQKSLPLSSSTRRVTIYKKKDDISSVVRFWRSTYESGVAEYDIMYPPKDAAQYLVEFAAVDNNHAVHITNQFGDQLPTTLDFLDSSYYSVTQHGIQNFEISFPKTKPSVYSVSFTADKLFWNIHLPSEKNTFNGTDKIIDLSQSILLKAMDFSKIQPGELHIENGDNMTYVDYYNFIFASDAAGKNRLHRYQYF